MKRILNITNGDSAVEIMKKAGIPGDYLPWRDVLHDGPVPGDLTLEELSTVRAAFIAERGWGSLKRVQQSFAERDDILKSYALYGRVILWFEHDLYDQLQILQILDWFDRQRPVRAELSLICTEQYLGMLSPHEMAALVDFEQPVSAYQLHLARKAWSAFRSKSAEDWFALLSVDTKALPFLRGAIIRQLEEYPSCRNGLSRTAHEALNIICQGETLASRVFAAYQQTEQRRFMGDASFWLILNEMLQCSPALLEFSEGRYPTLPEGLSQPLSITPAGQAVMACTRNWLDIVCIDRWIGGVHLRADNHYCWNAHSGSLIRGR